MIVYGALARGLQAIINKLPPNVAESACLPAVWHKHLEKTFPGIKATVKAAQKAGFTPVVIYGDCSTRGQLDVFLEEENVARIHGSHCCQSLIGDAGFDATMDQKPGTFFLTDCIVRHLERIMIKGMGRGDHPYLRNIYFAQYKRVLNVAQTDNAALVEKARQAAAKLQQDHDHHYTGNGDDAAFLYNLYRRRHPSVAAS